MELVLEILSKLRSFEKRSIREAFRNATFEHEKVGKFFDLVTQYHRSEEAFYAFQLYGKEPDNTFRVTKSRLKRHLENELLDDKSLGIYPAEYITATLKARKKLLQGEILLGRGAYLSSKNLLEDVIAIARKFALHQELFQAELLLSRNQAINKSTHEYRKSIENLLNLNQIVHQVHEAALLHYRITNLLSTTTLSAPDELATIQKDISRIEQIASVSGSPHALGYFLLTGLLFCQYTYDFARAKEYSRAYLNLVTEVPALSSPQRIGNATFQLAETAFRAGDLDEAAVFAEKALNCFSPDETNFLVVMETAFRIAFARKDDSTCLRLIEGAIQHPRFSASKLRAAKWHFFHACLHLRTGNPRKAQQALMDANALLQDKAGWNLAYRILELMVLFETGNTEVMDSRIQNLRHFVQRTRKGSEDYRSQAIISMFLEWNKYGLDLDLAMPYLKRRLKALAEHHRDMPYNPGGYELIRFEDWLDRMSANKG